MAVLTYSERHSKIVSVQRAVCQVFLPRRIGAQQAGFDAHEASTGQEGLRPAAEQPPDVILPDLGLPDDNGFQVIERIRAWSSVPIDLARRQVFVADSEVHLPSKEYRLLTTLIKNAGKVLTHRQLLKEVWRTDCTHETHNLRVCINQLRHKLGNEVAGSNLIMTEPGVDYRLHESVWAADSIAPPRSAGFFKRRLRDRICKRGAG